jgi:hypothetical protein
VAVPAMTLCQIIPMTKPCVIVATHRRKLTCPVQQELRALEQPVECFDGGFTLNGLDNDRRTFGLDCAALDLQTNHRGREGAFETVEPGDEFDRRQIFRHVTGEQIVDGLDVCCVLSVSSYPRKRNDETTNRGSAHPSLLRPWSPWAPKQPWKT